MRLTCLVACAALAASPATFVLAQASASPTPPPAAASAPHLVAAGDLMATLKGSADFSILTKALDDTNMSQTVASTPGLTLFAPTDEAFKALPPAELTALLDPKNVNILQRVLTYHLIHLDLDTGKFKGAKGPVQTVEASSVVVDGSGAVPKVNDADIIQPDVRATNGIIQVVDKVLIPTDVSLPRASASESTPPAAGR